MKTFNTIRRPTKYRKTRDTLKSIYQDFMKINTPLLTKEEFSPVYTSVFKEGSELPKQRMFSYRRLFSATEGNWILINFKSRKSLQELENLWTMHHQVIFHTQGDYRVPSPYSYLLGSHEEGCYFIKAEIDWQDLNMNGITWMEAEVTIGNLQTKFVSEDIYVCPEDFKVRGKAGSLSFYEDESEEDGDNQTRRHSRKCFDRTDGWTNIHVFYKCGIPVDKFLRSPTGAEVEFGYHRKDGELIQTTVVEGQEEPDGRTVFHDWAMTSLLPDGEYTVTVSLMGEVLKQADIRLGKPVNKVRKGAGVDRIAEALFAEAQTSMSSSLAKLEAMIGLTEVKKVIRCNTNYMKMMKLRQEAGLATTGRMMNMIFSGNPGTGKTSVARIIGQILADIGVLSKGHLVECNRESLIDNIVGGTEKKTREMIDKSEGGVLFVDEAYSLLDEGCRNDFGQRVIDTLMPYLSDEKADRVVILAGYEKEMAKLCASNPGLASRFPVRLHFSDYSVDELMQMTARYLAYNDYTLTGQVGQRIREVIQRASGIQTFGAGRFCHTFIQNIVLPNMATRLMEGSDGSAITEEMLRTIRPEDIPGPEEVLSLMGLRATAVPGRERTQIGFRR